MPSFAFPDGVEVIWRHGSGGSYMVLLNHTNSEVVVRLERPVPDRLSDGALRTAVRLASRGVAILRRPPPKHRHAE